MDSRNRGGLLKVNKLAVDIFVECEKEFQIYVNIFYNKIDSDLLVKKLLMNSTIKSYFSQLRDFCSVKSYINTFHPDTFTFIGKAAKGKI